jgi:PAS domain S-box-containing protein
MGSSPKTSKIDERNNHEKIEPGNQMAFQKLTDALAYAESIVDTVREPMLVLDAQLRVKTASRSFCRTFGVSPEETEGQFIYDLGNGQWNIPGLRILLEEIMPQENSFENFEVSHDFPSLGKRVMLLNARKLWREENNTQRILLAIEDVTERKRMENEILRSNEDFQSFAYAAAHDLRTPLNVSLNLSKMLAASLESRLSPKEKEMLALSINSMERLDDLMNDILTYSSVNNSSENQTLVPIKEALDVSLINLQQIIQESKADIVTGAMPELSVPRALAVIVFQNLIGNALKYRRDEKPRIEINAEQKDRFWRFSVQDNGQGFDQQYAKQIFEPFKRLHGSKIPGSGIGLATCKRVIERLGGEMWVKSQPGTGSTFSFTLPV